MLNVLICFVHVTVLLFHQLDCIIDVRKLQIFIVKCNYAWPVFIFVIYFHHLTMNRAFNMGFKCILLVIICGFFVLFLF